MRRSNLLAVLVVAWSLPLTSLGVSARTSHHHTAPTHKVYRSTTVLSNNRYYTNSKGRRVHSPAYSVTGGVPSGASAKCSDGTYSFSQSHRGTCSHHGGVAEWLQ